MLDLTHEHQISICYLLFHNNHRLRYGLTPGIVKLWESPQQSWGFIDDDYQNTSDGEMTGNACASDGSWRICRNTMSNVHLPQEGSFINIDLLQ